MKVSLNQLLLTLDFHTCQQFHILVRRVSNNFIYSVAFLKLNERL